MESITRKTRFVDLPAPVQQQLLSIDREKQVQIQIGRSIIVSETEKELRSVAQTVQKLSQDLQVVRMTLGGDKERVEDASAQIAFAVRHAERGASLVAHATDDGSWALSGLTPMQVASRQRALQALQQQTEAEIKEGAADQAGDGVVDPVEAVRRIQFASVNYDVASDYYWDWLTRVEAAALVLAERMDQVERLVNTSQEPSSISPRTVSDVIQFQNESLLAIAAKVAALDDDVRRLKKKLTTDN
ncbi:hypothetical protein GGI20_003292 [Coemansia sp. BCRC 34301]|nr:hypothetical protein GGI20_003292 [Coemansia sp. BCRC 34301]